MQLRKKAPTYYQAMLRVMQVRNEINLSQGCGHTKTEYKYQVAFNDDPLIKSGLLDALYKKDVGEAAFKSRGWARASILMRTELLRCFPVQKADDDLSLNRIIDVLCWYYVNVVRKGLEMYNAQDPQIAGRKSVDQIQVDLLYRVFCCPNCVGKPGYADESEKELTALRRNVHDRMGYINTYYKRVLELLDADILDQPDTSKSFVYNFRATDPNAEINNLVRAEVYKRWTDMNPRKS